MENVPVSPEEIRPSKSHRGRWILIILVVAALAAGVHAWQRNRPTPEAPPVEQQEDNKPQNDNQADAEVKTFEVSGQNFSFAPSEIRVKKGDRVKINFTNQNGLHDWVLDEFSARTPKIQSGQTASVEFVADKTGTFEFYCSVGEHRAMGMKGNFIVEE